MPNSADTFDRLDRAILKIVQKDNQRTYASIGEEIGLSLSAVRRRLDALRKNGVIARDVSILHQDRRYVRVIVTITLRDATPEAYESVERLIQETPEVLQAYHVAGGEDYVLHITCPNLPWYEDWSLKMLAGHKDIRFFETKVVWSCKKFETALPFFEEA